MNGLRKPLRKKEKNLQRKTFTPHERFENCKKSLEHSIEVIPDYFTSLALKLTAEKTDFIVFGKKINHNHRNLTTGKSRDNSSEISGCNYR